MQQRRAAPALCGCASSRLGKPAPSEAGNTAVPQTRAADDYLLFRNRLRADPEDRDLYERTKRALIKQDWAEMNAYAGTKTAVIAGIKERARQPRH